MRAIIIEDLRDAIQDIVQALFFTCASLRRFIGHGYMRLFLCLPILGRSVGHEYNLLEASQGKADRGVQEDIHQTKKYPGSTRVKMTRGKSAGEVPPALENPYGSFQRRVTP